MTSYRRRYDQIQNDPRLSRYQKVEQVSKLLGYQSDEQLIDALYQNLLPIDSTTARAYTSTNPKGA